MEQHEKEELKWLKKISQQENLKYKKTQEKIANLETLDECFEREFYKKLKRKTNQAGQALQDFFTNNSFLKEWEIDYALKDNVNGDKEIIFKLIKKMGINVDKILKNTNEVVIEKEYLTTFVISYDILAYLMATKNSSRSGSHSRLSRGFQSAISIKYENFRNDALLLNFNKLDNFHDIAVNVDALKSNIDISKIKYKTNKKRANSLYKYIKKALIEQIENNIHDKRIVLSHLKIYTLNIQHVLLPIYNVRFVKEGLDYKFKINGNTREIDRYYLD